MEKLEIHTLICKRDIDWFLKTIKLFSHYTEKKFEIVIHEDGSFEPSDFSFLYGVLNNLTIIEIYIQEIHLYLKIQTQNLPKAMKSRR